MGTVSKKMFKGALDAELEEIQSSFNVCPGRDNPAIADSSDGLQNLGTATNPSSLNAFILCIDSSCSPVFQGLAGVPYGHGSDLGCLGRDRVKSTKKVRI